MFKMDKRVATLSKSYLISKGINMQSLRLVQNLRHSAAINSCNRQHCVTTADIFHILSALVVLAAKN